ncbi:MAG: hypothetical protein EOP06_23650, partial [Proteobacteria bacterium]
MKRLEVQQELVQQPHDKEFHPATDLHTWEQDVANLQDDAFKSLEAIQQDVISRMPARYLDSNARYQIQQSTNYYMSLIGSACHESKVSSEEQAHLQLRDIEVECGKVVRTFSYALNMY